ncbi:MAG: hypothetical protein WEB58_10475 [Planctomycetaceae bacterium]
MPRPSFVLGNSWQLNYLSPTERAALDREPFVLVCNCFPENWRKIGFRPTVWAFGDTHNSECCQILADQLTTIRSDVYLRERLRHLFVCCESAEAERIVARCELPIIRYRRGSWARREQRLATSLSEPIYHYGSTLTDLVNLAQLLNPGQEVRICGGQHGRILGHFYNRGDEIHAVSAMPREFERMWKGFGDLVRAGHSLVDCNFEHDVKLPRDGRLPRKALFEGMS